MSKLSKEIKNRMSREFRQYWNNKKKLKKIQGSGNTSTRTILLCEERIGYIENVIAKLKPYEKQVFYFIFKYNYDCAYCESIKNISKSTYYNIYNKCINLLAEEWGVI